jgi:hypothetical protein
MDDHPKNSKQSPIYGFPLLWDWNFAFLGCSFVFLDVIPSILFLVFPLLLGALVYLWLARFHQFEGILEQVHPSSLFWALLLFITFNKVIRKEENEENLGFWVKFEDGQNVKENKREWNFGFF